MQLTRFFTLFLLAFTSLSFFYGCQFGDDNQGIVIDEMPLSRRIGVIKSLGGVKTESQGTHLLELDDGDTVLLRSTALNLDDSTYRDVLVEVRGVITYTKDSKALMEVQNIDIVDEVPVQETPSAGWETYKNSLLGFRIDYQDDFTLKEDAPTVTFTKVHEEEEASDDFTLQDEEKSEDADEESVDETSEAESSLDEANVVTISVEVGEKDEAADLLGFVGIEDDEPSTLLTAGLVRSKIGLQNFDALKQIVEEDNSTTFFVEGEDAFYTIRLVNNPDLTEYENLFFDMLQTFQLAHPLGGVEATDGFDAFDEDDLSEGLEDDGSETVVIEPPADVDSYETFTSESVGFSISYPKSWYFEGVTSDKPGYFQEYSFGDAPLDEQEGSVTLAITSPGAGTSGASTVTFQGVSLLKSPLSGGQVAFTLEGDGRDFRVEGPESLKGMLATMTASVTEIGE